MTVYMAPCLNILLWAFLPCEVVSLAIQRLAVRASTVPAPVVVPPSQSFEGNDGPWSSFTLQIGMVLDEAIALASTC